MRDGTYTGLPHSNHGFTEGGGLSGEAGRNKVLFEAKQSTYKLKASYMHDGLSGLNFDVKSSGNIKVAEGSLGVIKHAVVIF